MIVERVADRAITLPVVLLAIVTAIGRFRGTVTQHDVQRPVQQTTFVRSELAILVPVKQRQDHLEPCRSFLDHDLLAVMTTKKTVNRVMGVVPLGRVKPMVAVAIEYLEQQPTQLADQVARNAVTRFAFRTLCVVTAITVALVTRTVISIGAVATGPLAVTVLRPFRSLRTLCVVTAITVALVARIVISIGTVAVGSFAVTILRPTRPTRSVGTVAVGPLAVTVRRSIAVTALRPMRPDHPVQRVAKQVLLLRPQVPVTVLVEQLENPADRFGSAAQRNRPATVLLQEIDQRPQRVLSFGAIEPVVAVLIEPLQQPPSQLVDKALTDVRMIPRTGVVVLCHHNRWCRSEQQGQRPGQQQLLHRQLLLDTARKAMSERPATTVTSCYPYSPSAKKNVKSTSTEPRKDSSCGITAAGFTACRHTVHAGTERRDSPVPVV